jgi:hypothetical protein
LFDEERVNDSILFQYIYGQQYSKPKAFSDKKVFRKSIVLRNQSQKLGSTVSSVFEKEEEGVGQ